MCLSVSLCDQALSGRYLTLRLDYSTFCYQTWYGGASSQQVSWGVLQTNWVLSSKLRSQWGLIAPSGGRGGRVVDLCSLLVMVCMSFCTFSLWKLTWIHCVYLVLWTHEVLCGSCFFICAKYEFSVIHSNQNITFSWIVYESKGAIVTTFYVSSKVFLNLLIGHLPTTSE